MKKPITILDIGSSKVVCIFGGRVIEKSLEVYGLAVEKHGGLRKREFLSKKTLRQAIASVIQQAEKEAKKTVRSLSVGVPGNLLEIIKCKSAFEVDQARKLMVDDVEKLVRRSVGGQKTAEKKVHLDSVIQSFTVDDEEYDLPPIGVSGKHFEATILNIYMLKSFETMIKEILDEMHIEINTFVDATYTESLLFLPLQTKIQSAVIIDIGYYQTDIVILKEGRTIFRKCLDVGGIHFANDITYVLEINEDDAENVKRRHVFGLDYVGQQESCHLIDGSTQKFAYTDIQNIIESRANEMAELFATILTKPFEQLDEKNVPIYLTGGGLVMMRGAREYFQSAMGMQIASTVPVLPKRSSASLYSAYGLLEYCLSKEQKNSKGSFIESFAQSIFDFFTK